MIRETHSRCSRRSRNATTRSRRSCIAQKAIEAWTTDPKVRRVYVLEVEDIRRRIAADKATADS